jgi:hypothetical protein
VYLLPAVWILLTVVGYAITGGQAASNWFGLVDAVPLGRRAPDPVRTADLAEDEHYQEGRPSPAHRHNRQA